MLNVNFNLARVSKDNIWAGGPDVNWARPMGVPRRLRRPAPTQLAQPRPGTASSAFVGGIGISGGGRRVFDVAGFGLARFSIIFRSPQRK